MYSHFTHKIANYRFLVILLQLLQKFLQYLLAEGGDHMAGIKEVAEEAGVSTATVSRALRGLHHVNQQTREKIIAAAEKLNYPLMSERQNLSLIHI